MIVGSTTENLSLEKRVSITPETANSTPAQPVKSCKLFTVSQLSKILAAARALKLAPKSKIHPPDHDGTGKKRLPADKRDPER